MNTTTTTTTHTNGLSKLRFEDSAIAIGESLADNADQYRREPLPIDYHNFSKLHRNSDLSYYSSLFYWAFVGRMDHNMRTNYRPTTITYETAEKRRDIVCNTYEQFDRLTSAFNKADIRWFARPW